MSRPPLAKAPQQIEVVGAAIMYRDRCLVARRMAGGASGGKWEFPGGKIEPHESPEAALIREISEELSTQIGVGCWLGRGTFVSAERTIVLDVFEARLTPEPQSAPLLAGPDHTETRWVTSEELAHLDWATADIPIIPAVEQRLRDAR